MLQVKWVFVILSQQLPCSLSCDDIFHFFMLFYLNSFKYGGKITNYQRKIAIFAAIIKKVYEI